MAGGEYDDYTNDEYEECETTTEHWFYTALTTSFPPRKTRMEVIMEKIIKCEGDIPSQYWCDHCKRKAKRVGVFLEEA